MSELILNRKKAHDSFTYTHTKINKTYEMKAMSFSLSHGLVDIDPLNGICISEAQATRCISLVCVCVLQLVGNSLFV